jgi:hypothetical protein
MAERTTSNTLIIIFTTLVVIFSVIILIQQAEAGLMFWTLRPSESTALDIVSKYTALGGTTGEVVTDYKNITQNINYNIHSHGKMVCVISRKEERGAEPLRTVNCYSTPFEVKIPKQSDKYEQEFHLCFKKYNTFPRDLRVDTWWVGLDSGCV